MTSTIVLRSAHIVLDPINDDHFDNLPYVSVFKAISRTIKL